MSSVPDLLRQYFRLLSLASSGAARWLLLLTIAVRLVVYPLRQWPVALRDRHPYSLEPKGL